MDLEIVAYNKSKGPVYGSMERVNGNTVDILVGRTPSRAKAIKVRVLVRKAR